MKILYLIEILISEIFRGWNTIHYFQLYSILTIKLTISYLDQYIYIYIKKRLIYSLLNFFQTRFPFLRLMTLLPEDPFSSWCFILHSRHFESSPSSFFASTPCESPSLHPSTTTGHHLPPVSLRQAPQPVAVYGIEPRWSKRHSFLSLELCGLAQKHLGKSRLVSFPSFALYFVMFEDELEENPCQGDAKINK